jgi:hypothetical protein
MGSCEGNLFLTWAILYFLLMDLLFAICHQWSSLPSGVSDRDKQGLFSLECQVALPPESFFSMRFPFVYVAVMYESMFPLKHFEQ